MNPSALENELREMLERRAADVQEANLRQSSDVALRAAPIAEPRPGRRVFALASALLLLTGVVVASIAVQEDGPPAPPAAGPDPAPAAASGARVWPLTNDTPLTSWAGAASLATPEGAVRAYLHDVAGLPDDWPLGETSNAGDTAVVHYVLQDVAAQVSVARDGELWFVTGARTDHVDGGAPVETIDGVDVSVGAGPRAYDSGAAVRAAAVAADGRTLATANTVVRRGPAGAAGAATVVSLRWPGDEMAAAVRVDVLDDHDGDKATPDVVVGHWSAAAPGITLTGLPREARELSTTEPLFTENGSASDVAERYMRARFPDYPAPGLRLERARTRAALTVVRWTSGSGGEHHATGTLLLRNVAEQWGVVAATTDGIDASGLRLTAGVDGTRLAGTVTSTNGNSMSADVLDARGEPVAGAPRPQGQPGAAYRFGTAAGPATKSLDIDVAVAEDVVVRINLVGGTLLSITEFRMPMSAPASA